MSAASVRNLPTSLFASVMGFAGLARAAWTAGVVFAEVDLFAMILSRLVHRAPLAAAARPSLMVLVAPFAVGFLAYTQMTGRVDAIAALLLYFGLFMFAVLTVRTLRIAIDGSLFWA